MDTHRPRRSRARALRAAAACLALVAMAGAGAQTVSLKTGGRQVRIAVGGDATLPANFPQDVPLPGAATLVRVQRGSGSTILEFTGTGEPDAAIADIDARMRANGWEPAMMKAPAAGRAQVWEKEQRAVIAWAAPEEAAPAADVVAAARAAADAKTSAAIAATAATDAHRIRIQLQLIARRGYSAP